MNDPFALFIINVDVLYEGKTKRDYNISDYVCHCVGVHKLHLLAKELKSWVVFERFKVNF